MRKLYTLVLYFLLPMVLLRLLWRSRKTTAYRQRWTERLGYLQIDVPVGGIWVHAVSVGEVQAAEPLIRHLQELYPDLALTMTTTTPTGYERVQRLFGDSVRHVYCPYDLPFALTRFLDRVQPILVILLETEIWPNMLASCEQRGVRVLLANARLSARSAAGYARLGQFTKETFFRIGQVAAQSEDDAARFIALGTPSAQVQVTGSIKFDLRIAASVREQIQVTRRRLGQGRSIWLAASTHEGEEEQILKVHSEVMMAIPGTLLILVPRHPERFDRVASLCKRHKFKVARRSLEQSCTADIDVYLGDTMGELPVLMGAVDTVFMGGSLVGIGGHNMLEASALGVPVSFGPHVFNFPVISKLLIEQQAAVQISNQQQLAEQIINWLSDASERSRIGENGRLVVEQNRGALERLQYIIAGLLGEAAEQGKSDP